MRFKRILFGALLSCILPLSAHALGLGKLELNSGLNQPLDARIELLSVTADELQSLTVRLADFDAFRRANIDRPFVLSSLRFQVVETDEGRDYIRVSTREPVREPFLNFLVEANWSNGRLFREYTVLLDPPLYDAGAGLVREPTVPAPGPSGYMPADESDEPAVMPETSAPAYTGYTGGDYGPTTSTDTLWSIASLVRPDASVTVQQMMLALLRTNPEAFANGNINGLKKGQVLRMPSEAELSAVPADRALDEVRSQNAVWNDIRGTIAAAAPAQPATAAPAAAAEAPAADVTPAPVESDPELRLVAPTEEGAAPGAGGGAATEGGDPEALALANEQLEALGQENTELKQQVTESEELIQDLRRLIELKDDELAALQAQIASAPEPEAATPAEPEPMEEEIVEEEPAMPEEAMEEEFPALEEAPSLEEDVMEEEPVEEPLMEEEPLAGEEPPPEEAMEPEPEPALPEPAPAPPGLVDQILGFVTGNIIIVGGALGGIIVIIALGMFVSRRRAAAADEEAALPADFPDFSESGSEAETELPVDSEDVTDLGPDAAAEAAQAEPPEAEPEASDADVTQFMAPPGGAAAEEEPAAAEPEEDPLAEVNVFLAYEHFDQAEEFVRDAIAGQPDNLEFHAKLLEVFYAANDRKKYEEAAKVLHDKVGGEGEHWDMAVAMWQEMSPNRALFEEPAAGEEEEAAPAAAAGGGIVDLTADDEAGADAGLDFDLGSGDEAPAGAQSQEDEVLDVTSGGGEDVLDVTAAESGGEEDMLDVTAAVSTEGESNEDLLDVTAAVGLDTETGGDEGEGGEDLLDLTGGSEKNEDLLDVTAHTDLESDELKEDLLDVTAATSAGADADDLLEVSDEPAASDDNSVDFDVGMEVEPEAGESSDDNVVDFDVGAQEEAEDAGLELASGDSEDAGLELTAGDSEAASEEGGLEFSMEDADSGAQEDGGLELDLSAGDEEEEPAADTGTGDEGGLEISLDDVGTEEPADEAPSEDGGFELELDAGTDEEEPAAAPTPEGEGDGDGELEFSLEMDDEPAGDDQAADIDMDGTVEIPKLDTSADDDDDDDDDDEDHTMFVPRSAPADEQSAEDEVSTKLDLAKAYVELGDKDSAKAIIDEIMADGNDAQKSQAQDLLNQLS